MARRDVIDPQVLQQAASTKPAVLPVVGRRAFEAEVLEADLPVVVDFHAPWCQPCGKMGEALATLAPLYAGKLKFVKVNLMENAWAREKFDITGIPLILLFSHGMLATGAELLGAYSRAALARHLDAIVERYT